MDLFFGFVFLFVTQDMAEMYVGDDVSPDFYGWVFPKYDHVGVGTGTVVNRPAIKDYQVGGVWILPCIFNSNNLKTKTEIPGSIPPFLVFSLPSSRVIFVLGRDVVYCLGLALHFFPLTRFLSL